MNPVAAAVRFPDQLVEMEVVHHPDEPLFAGLFIRNMNVGRFARQDDIWGMILPQLTNPHLPPYANNQSRYNNRSKSPDWLFLKIFQK